MPSGKRRADSAAPAPLNRPLALAEPGPYLRAAILWNVEFANLVVLNLGRSFKHLRESLQDFGVGVAAIVVRVLFPIPQTDRDRFGAVAGEERDLVLEAVLLAQYGQDVCFHVRASCLLNYLCQVYDSRRPKKPLYLTSKVHRSMFEPIGLPIVN